MRRRLALALAAALILGVAGCSGEDGGVALPSGAPSFDRPSRTATTEPEETEAEKTEDPERTLEATRTRETADPEPTDPETADPEPTEEETTQPARTTDPPQAAEPTKTQPPPPTAETRTETKTVTEEPAATTATASSAAAVPVSENEDSGGFLPWLLVFLAIGAVVAIVLISRSRRETAWDGEGRALGAETRSVIGVRLPPVLTAQTAPERGLAWPPVRDDLRDLSARWGVLAQNAPDSERQASASQIAVLLRDLVPAIDAENEALVTGRDWRMLRPQVDQILDALTAIMQPQPTTYRRPPTPPPAEPYYA